MVKLTAFLLWLLLSLIFRVSARYTFYAGILLIFISLLTRIIGRLGFSLNILFYSFGLLVIGCSLYLWEIIRYEKN